MNTLSSKQAVFFIASLNALLVFFYIGTMTQLLEFWSESYGYSHGILLFPVVLGIYFYELYKSPRLTLTQLNLFTSTIFITLISAWFLADLLSIQVIEFFAFFCIILFFNFILTSDNFKNIKHLWPIVLIIFTLPLWDFIADILRTIETPIVVLALKLSFIDTFQDGFLIHVPAGTFLVETACSGFNQFIVSVPLASLYIYSRNLNLITGFKFVFVLLFLAIIFNILRIYIIVVAGQVTHMKTSLLDDHEYLAWLIYGIGVFLLFLYSDRKLAQPENIESQKDLSINLTKVRKPIYSLIFLISIGPLLSISYFTFKNKTTLDTEGLVKNLFWKETGEATHFVPAFDKGDLVYDKQLSNIFGQTVNLYINYFVEQEQGREAINDVMTLVDKEKGSILQQNQHNVKLPQNTGLMVNEAIVVLVSGEKFVTWQWYFVNGQHINKNVEARYNNLMAILKNRPQMSSIVISKKLTVDEHNARKMLELFVLDNLAILTEYLGSK